jgi:hypothetical protein
MVRPSCTFVVSVGASRLLLKSPIVMGGSWPLFGSGSGVGGGAPSTFFATARASDCSKASSEFGDADTGLPFSVKPSWTFGMFVPSWG